MTASPKSRQSWPTRVRVAVGALISTTILAGDVAFGTGWPAWANQDDTAPLSVPAVAGLPGSFANLVDAVKPAVVSIVVSKHAPKTVAGDRQGAGAAAAPKAYAVGSGFIIDAAGDIVTNHHVAGEAATITVMLADGTTYDAKVIGTDPETDLALLKITAAKPLPYLRFSDSANARVGDWVIAIGNPYGLGGTVTAGIISARGRDIGAGPYDDFIQIDAPINPGNSGGPLFDESGKVIGVSTAIYSPNGGSVGIGFAIPSATVTEVVAKLRKHGTFKRGWLGVAMQPVPLELAQAIGLAKSDGVLINKIEPDSPAASADLRQGDVITAFDGKSIKGPRDLARDVADAKGEAAKLTLWRDGMEQTVTVNIGTAPVGQGAESAPPAAERGV
jgi:serine protease Do